MICDNGGVVIVSESILLVVLFVGTIGVVGFGEIIDFEVFYLENFYLGSYVIFWIG